MKQYCFYFDEAFHDKKIILDTDGFFNANRPDGMQNYVGVYVGCRMTKRNKYEQMWREFEAEQKRIYTVDGELKSSTILSPKCCKNGLASFNRNALGFYKGLFTTLEKMDLHIQMECVNKIEYFVRQVFRNMKLPRSVRISKDSFMYSLSKFLVFYGSVDLLKALVVSHDMDSLNHFLRLLDGILSVVIHDIRNIERKKYELEAFEQIRWIVRNMPTFAIDDVKKYAYCYTSNFDGLLQFLHENKISDDAVTIIMDSCPEMYVISEKYQFKSVSQVDSRDCIGVRVSDWIAGFVGRIMWAMQQDDERSGDIRPANIDGFCKDGLEDRHFLNDHWFKIDESRFLLYQKLNNLFNDRWAHYWTVLTLSYADLVGSFFSLLRYFGMYDDYSEYKDISLNEHQELFEAACCRELQRCFSQF